MDFEKVEFSDWQIEKMRSALRKYRSLHTSGGCLPSWNQVCDKIARSKSNLYKYPKDGSEPALKHEALRRFVQGINGSLAKERLPEVAKFLNNESLFDPEDLLEDKDDLANLSALQDFFSKEVDGSNYFLKVFNRPMEYILPTETNEQFQTKIILSFTPDVSGKFVRIEEAEQSVNLVAKRRNDALRYRKKASESEYTKTVRRKGYGFLVTYLNILHAFLNGNEPGDQMTYVQAGELHENSPDNGIYLMRNGTPTGRNRWEKDLYYKEPIVLPNIYRFMPEKTEEPQRSRSETEDGQG
ncbi:hypothetical protein [Pseudomonas sp. R5(2019)]|uniref:hypothetical protein n=1 Tax=Pseudomonas sp. R5(2019) TaxID=2697566 RepID=UPI001412C2C1|nr:hypothetical protein [Pseudomonas sp. R5(2019)]NBA98552.1 hypothetical protein [Pseudomonas sp. R5(2019)]